MSGRDGCKGNVRYTAIGRISDRVLIATYRHYTSGPTAEKYLAVSQKVLNSDKVLSQQSANVPKALDDSSCLMQTDKTYMYIVFVETNYPERTAFELLRLIRKEFTEKVAGEAASATENSLSKSVKKWMTTACTKYDDVTAVNKVSAVQAQVDDVKMTMEDNVQNMLKQHQKLEDLEDKADNMRQEANKFRKGATSLARKMWWQNCRLMAVIIVVTIIILMSSSSLSALHAEANDAAGKRGRKQEGEGEGQGQWEGQRDWD
eukprot:CAMPEP_0181315746 /NCGR_PEP_ID=MMETSP1101-20121128/15536_1 /TAXON_ID=46948 /ORGANISM="Rhodomonas abbreviata, Strain Caron Lab Isolate" /LENGTH=260 /DNA_ID=CAMNT_0023422967 /DNA_START=26 /DNA_END=806 /DNA_ORIENTATION=+